jgi:hypothetical protein
VRGGWGVKTFSQKVIINVLKNRINYIKNDTDDDLARETPGKKLVFPLYNIHYIIVDTSLSYIPYSVLPVYHADISRFSTSQKVMPLQVFQVSSLCEFKFLTLGKGSGQVNYCGYICPGAVAIEKPGPDSKN